jgi:FkbM family methyltransferase
MTNLALTRIPFFPVWPEMVDLDGVKVLLRRSPLTPRMRRRLMRGGYETAERTLVKSFVQTGDQVLELGASSGVLTCFLAKAVGPDGRVVSVEPNAALRGFFCAQLHANGVRAELVQAIACPVWGGAVPPGLAEQYFAPSPDSLSGRAVAGRVGGNEVPRLTAEAVAHANQLVPTVLVVDVEGSEAVWAERPPHLPESVRLVIAEFHPRITGPGVAGQAVQAIVDEGFRVVGLSQTVLAFARRE